MANIWYATCVKRDGRGTITDVGMGTDPSGAGRQAYPKANVAKWLKDENNKLYAPNPDNPREYIEVHPIDGPGGPYLRTAADGTTADNLEHMPECDDC